MNFLGLIFFLYLISIENAQKNKEGGEGAGMHPPLPRTLASFSHVTPLF